MTRRCHDRIIWVNAMAICGLVVFGTATFASATVLGIDAAIFTPTPDATPEPDPTALTGFTIDGATYSDINGATASDVVGGSARFYAANGTDSGSHAAALSGLSVTDAVANVSSVDFTLAQTVNAADNVGFFMFEITKAGTSASADAVTVKPLDTNGSLISTWSLLINSSDYGAYLGQFDVAGSSTDIFPGGVVFSVDDFTGGTGELTGIAGLRFIDDQGTTTWDPILAGTYVVPEPSAMVMLGLILLPGVLFWRRKWAR